jgi:hypothetical protein
MPRRSKPRSLNLVTSRASRAPAAPPRYRSRVFRFAADTGATIGARLRLPKVAGSSVRLLPLKHTRNQAAAGKRGSCGTRPPRCPHADPSAAQGPKVRRLFAGGNGFELPVPREGFGSETSLWPPSATSPAAAAHNRATAACRRSWAIIALGRSCIARGTGSSNPFPSSSESAANPMSVSLRDRAIVTPRLPAEAAEAADRHLYFS